MPQHAQQSLGPLTVVQMAERLQLSRRRFYELIDAGKLPPPVYRIDTRKPFYPPEIQEVCLHVRVSGEAIDGSVLLFNRPRTRLATRPQPRSNRSVLRPDAPVNNEHADMLAYLAEHGLTVTADETAAAVHVCFPGGITEVEPGRVWREVFRHLRARNRT